MNVIIFGATGSIGRLAVKQMLSAGHKVTAFARAPEKLAIKHPKLALISGDAMDRQAVHNAIKGQDAVIVTLGAGTSRKSLVRSKGTENIIAGMHAQGVRRLICQSTLGAHESWSNLNFFWKRIMFGLLLRPVFKEHERQEILVRESGLDWTLIRPSAFTDEPASGSFREAIQPGERDLALKISRADVAAFLTRQLCNPRYLQQAVSISN